MPVGALRRITPVLVLLVTAAAGYYAWERSAADRTMVPPGEEFTRRPIPPELRAVPAPGARWYAETPAANRHVLLIGVDGCRTDALQAAAAPNLHRLIRTGAYDPDTLIRRAGYTKSLTESGPGWTTIFTGVWHDKHQVGRNNDLPSRLDQYPDVCARVRVAHPRAWIGSFASWPYINANIVRRADRMDIPRVDSSGVTAAQQADRKDTRAAIETLAKENPELLYLYYLQVDEEGHATGFSPANKKYMDAIARVDQLIGSVLEAVAERRLQRHEEWLVMVVTDHGGIGTYHSYLQDAPPDITRTFLIAQGDGIIPGAVAELTGLVDVAPTIIAYLGIGVDPRWKLDGTAIGPHHRDVRLAPQTAREVR